MLSRYKFGGWVLFWIVALVARDGVAAVPAEERADAVAAHLEQAQVKEGPNQGLWPPEVMFAGPPTAGMACAYKWLEDPLYKQSAELGGDYILWVGVAQGQLLGDEVYALVCLSEISDDPNDNVWRTALVDFFEGNRRRGGTTEEYLELFTELEASAATFYVAHHTVGAYYVDDIDKGIWRDALIRHLAGVDDESDYPVMALGAATWALATTGPLDETLVGASVGYASYWQGIFLCDLPLLLLMHQVPEGEPFGGSFYWRFDHTAGPSDPEGLTSGFTEDAIYSALGLAAAAALATDPPNEDLEQAVRTAYAALLDGVDEEGKVYEHLSHAGESYYAYSGEMLQGLWGVARYIAAQENQDVNEVEVSAEPGVQ